MEEYKKDPTRPFFKVEGTGFLVRRNTVITNRHVIQSLLYSQKEFGFSNKQQLLMFVYPKGEAGWEVEFAEMGRLGFITDQALDVGFCDFAFQPKQELGEIMPLDLRTTERLSIGDPIAVCGYPFGHSMLHKDSKVYRWGPVVQQGFISALSPFDTAMEPEEILLDVRAAGGMSGAPVFRLTDGKIIGILHSTWEATTALALPIRREAVDAWLKQHDTKSSA
jgi:V8-like Glu-specific endopeptidase